jgi:glycosyltransferase involved in cell wall biosynthesis
MKIIFFIDSLRSGGKERRITELMKMLSLNNNIQFELVVMSNDVHYKEVLDLNIKIHYLIRNTKKDISIFKKFYKICKDYRPDLVHCWDSMTAVYAIPACKLLNIILINGMITDAPLNQNIFNVSWFRARFTFPFSNIILGNSRAGLIAYRAPEKRSFCIHNGFNFERLTIQMDSGKVREELNIKTEFIIGMVASFADSKDYRTYFKAAELLLKSRRDITFLAIGSDTDSIAAKNLVKDTFTENFRFMGKRSNIESLINSMDICVLSTFTEGISNSILEYMALGKPVIATSGGGTDELIEEQKTGFLIHQSEPEELAQKMETLLNDQELRNKFGMAGKERVQKHFSIDKMVNRYISLCTDSLLMKN